MHHNHRKKSDVSYVKNAMNESCGYDVPPTEMEPMDLEHLLLLVDYLNYQVGDQILQLHAPNPLLMK
jgi:hypothetical protein